MLELLTNFEIIGLSLIVLYTILAVLSMLKGRKFLFSRPTENQNSKKSIYNDYMEAIRRELDKAHILAGFSLAVLALSSIFPTNLTFRLFISLSFIMSLFSTILIVEERRRIFFYIPSLLNDISKMFILISLISFEPALSILFLISIFLMMIIGLERWYKLTQFWSNERK